MVDKIAHYLMCKGGVYYFTRHVPNDIQRHYSKPRIVMCLKTRSKNAALKASNALASKLDDFWLQMRIGEMDVPASSLLIRGKLIKAFTSCGPTHGSDDCVSPTLDLRARTVSTDSFGTTQ